MKKTLWYMYKPGDTRDYAFPSPPSETWMAQQKADGFLLYAVEVDVPVPGTTPTLVAAPLVLA